MCQKQGHAELALLVKEECWAFVVSLSRDLTQTKLEGQKGLCSALAGVSSGATWEDELDSRQLNKI